MDAPEAQKQSGTRTVSAVVLVAVAALGAAVGFIESAFGPYLALLIGFVVLGLGALVRRWDAAWSTLLMVFGAGMCVGVLAYIVVGLLGPTAPASGAGAG